MKTKKEKKCGDFPLYHLTEILKMIEDKRNINEIKSYLKKHGFSTKNKNSSIWIDKDEKINVRNNGHILDYYTKK